MFVLPRPRVFTIGQLVFPLWVSAEKRNGNDLFYDIHRSLLAPSILGGEHLVISFFSRGRANAGS